MEPVKKVTKTIIVPAQPESSYEETMYSCAICGEEFEGYDADEDAKKHFGAKHAVAAKVKYGLQTAYLIKDAASYDAFLEASLGYGDMMHQEWDGPGWYRIRRGAEPCGRGCCTRDFVALEPLADVVLEARLKIKRQLETIELVESVIALGLDYVTSPDFKDDDQ